MNFSIAELTSALPIIASLVILEGLLSVDNALVIAAMVSHLEGKQKILALRAGIIGAYVLRGLMLLCAAFIISHPWIKLVGAGYLIYLMCSNLALAEDGEEESHRAAKGGFWMTVLAVEMADLAFSIDNVVAAVALSPKLWVVMTGVLIGITAMRFVAQLFIKLLDKFPILEQVAYCLVGYVGLQLVADEMTTEDPSEMVKFGIIMLIIIAGIIYERSKTVQKICGPTLRWIGEGMGNLCELIDWFVKPLRMLVKSILALFKIGVRKGDDEQKEVAEATTTEAPAQASTPENQGQQVSSDGSVSLTS